MKLFHIFFSLILTLSLEIYWAPELLEKYSSDGCYLLYDITLYNKGAKLEFKVEFYSFFDILDYTIDISESISQDYNSNGKTKKIKPISSSIISDDNFYYGKIFKYDFIIELETDNNYLLINPNTIPERYNIKPRVYNMQVNLM